MRIFFIFLFLMGCDQGIYPLKVLPIQQGGRVKPFDTFARESLRSLHGKETLQKEAAVKIMMSFFLTPKLWLDVKFIKMESKALREVLGLEEKRLLYSFREIFGQKKTRLLLTELQKERKKGAKLSPFYKDVQELENKILLFNLIRKGGALKIIPEDPHWLDITSLKGEKKKAFHEWIQSYILFLRKGEVRSLQEKLGGFQLLLDYKGVSFAKIHLEVFLNTLSPFFWAWIFYLLSFLLGIFLWKKPHFRKAFLTFLGAGFLLHTLGMLIRSYLMGRPPVSNMYESLVWVPWVSVLLSSGFFYIYKKNILFLAGSFVGFLCLFLLDLAPVVLDDTLQPLEPVLRDNFWLTTHVLIVTLSYGAFFLALFLGNVFFYFRLKKPKDKKIISEITNLTYRLIQVGVVLLALGTILGGVWADFSWGRFWGWDPKETWALISLLGYLAILHGRFVGWVKDFGLALGAVFGFTLILMTWYGVNFVLGAGLHSYGFGGGGLEFVLSYLFLQWSFVFFIVIKDQRFYFKS